jgi:hypothetical protein
MLDYDNPKSIEFTELCTYFGYYTDGEAMSDWSDPATSLQPPDGTRTRPGAADREAESNMPTESDSSKTGSYRRDYPREPGVAPELLAGRRTREDYALFCQFAGATTQTLTTNISAGAQRVKVPVIVTLYSQYSGTLTFQNFSQGAGPRVMRYQLTAETVRTAQP